MSLSRDPTLDPTMLLGRRLEPLPPPLDERASFFCAYGRHALWQALRLVDVAPGDNVLLPAYICDVVVHPLTALGLEPRFVAIGRDLGLDLDGLASQIDERSRAIIAVHYFGFPAPRLAAVAELARARRLALIEDCAHALLSGDGESPLGTVGDASIFSLRKTLPLPGGAALVVNSARLLRRVSQVPELAPPGQVALADDRGGEGSARPARPARSSLRPVLGLLADRLEQRSGLPARDSFQRIVRAARRARLPLMAPDRRAALAEERFDQCQGPMNGWAMRILRATDLHAVRARRRAAYELLHSHLGGGLARLAPAAGPLLPGVCPLAYPVLAADRPRLEERLRDAGIEAYPWPFLPAELPRCPEQAAAWYLAEHLLALPVHQDATPAQLERLVSVVTASL